MNTERFWVTYKTSSTSKSVPHYLLDNRTGFIYDEAAAVKTAEDLARFEHVSDVNIERITPVLQVKP